MIGLRKSCTGSLCFACRRAFRVRGLGVVISVVALLLTACKADIRQTYVPAAVTPVASFIPEYHFYDEETDSNIYYSITIVNQSLINGYLSVDDVECGETGWLVIYSYDQRRTGAVVGFARLLEGENDDFLVKINPDLSTPVLFAVIHTDNGSHNVFEYPEFDPPVVFNGMKIGIPVQIEDPHN